MRAMARAVREAIDRLEGRHETTRGRSGREGADVGRDVFWGGVRRG